MTDQSPVLLPSLLPAVLCDMQSSCSTRITPSHYPKIEFYLVACISFITLLPHTSALIWLKVHSLLPTGRETERGTCVFIGACNPPQASGCHWQELKSISLSPKCPRRLLPERPLAALSLDPGTVLYCVSLLGGSMLAPCMQRNTAQHTQTHPRNLHSRGSTWVEDQVDFNFKAYRNSSLLKTKQNKTQPLATISNLKLLCKEVLFVKSWLLMFSVGENLAWPKLFSFFF